MVNGRDVPITIDESHEKLINRENTLKSATTPDLSVPATANATQFRTYQQIPQYSSSRGGSSASRGGFRPSRPYLGKISSLRSPGTWCATMPTVPTTTALSQYDAQPSTQYRRSTLSQNKAPWQHQARHLPLPPPQWSTQVNHTTMSSSDLKPWLLDSGSSHHITSGLNNLSLHTPYNGGKNVMIGNGTCLSVTHTG